jgi:hypothetical protein
LYNVRVPAAGRYTVVVRHASGVNRPLKLRVNGLVVAERTCASVTGGHQPTDQKWELAGTFDFREGPNVVVFEREGEFPHLDKFVLTPAEAAGESSPAR